MIKQANRDAAALGVSRTPLSALEQVQVSTQLTRRFKDFDVPVNASKADVVDALVRHLLERQRGG